jgi:hypothetical protein
MLTQQSGGCQREKSGVLTRQNQKTPPPRASQPQNVGYAIPQQNPKPFTSFGLLKTA